MIIPPPPWKITIVACAIIVHSVEDGTFPRCSVYVFSPLTRLFVVVVRATGEGRKRGEKRKIKTSSLREREKERKKERKKERDTHPGKRPFALSTAVKVVSPRSLTGEQVFRGEKKSGV